MVDVAFAADAAAGGAAGPQGLMSFLPLILIFVVFYFLLIRTQQKKAKEHQEFVANLKKGDEVLTSGGLQGKITGLTDRVATIEIAENVRVKIARSYILGSLASMEGGEKKEGAACAIGSKGG
ncbi:MAG: preprotein translocase subunit YajC [Desulfobulbaceae bacterium]|nr:preprotein translocase subunit YajC [Desulfobulbaceae bacterium]HIJ89265.1 preprotein translocase subunit YajC [Deltaproteobacteria bacterium]